MVEQHELSDILANVVPFLKLIFLLAYAAMSDFKEIEASALRLNEKQRARFARRLLGSLEPLSDNDVERAWIAATERRSQEVEAGEVDTITAEEVFQKARRLLG